MSDCQLIETEHGKKMWDMRMTCSHATCGLYCDPTTPVRTAPNAALRIVAD